VIYEVTGIGESDHTVDALRYSVPLTVINEYDFRNQSKLISRVDELYGFGYVDPKADWTEPSTIRQRLMMDSRLKNFKASLHDIHLRGINVNRDIHGERKFELERNGSVNKIITRFYQGEEHNEPS
jgi:hypothetical protein